MVLFLRLETRAEWPCPHAPWHTSLVVAPPIRLKYQRRGMGNAPIVGLWECRNRRTFAPSKRHIND